MSHFINVHFFTIVLVIIQRIYSKYLKLNYYQRQVETNNKRNIILFVLQLYIKYQNETLNLIRLLPDNTTKIMMHNLWLFIETFWYKTENNNKNNLQSIKQTSSLIARTYTVITQHCFELPLLPHISPRCSWRDEPGKVCNHRCIAMITPDWQ